MFPLDFSTLELTQLLSVDVPEKTAIWDTDSAVRYSYADLVSLATSIKAEILSSECGSETPVAILVPRSFEFYASQMAVLSAGSFFLPIDNANPIERIEFLISDSGAQTVLVDQHTAGMIGHLADDVRLIDVSAVPRKDVGGISELPFAHAPEDLAYMIYTSGSTGQPKGVPIPWAALHNHNQWFVEEFGITEEDRCMQMASVGFDISLEEIFTTLRSGATLYPIGKEALDTPSGFFRWVEQHQLTVLNIPTALWHNLVPALESVRLADSVRLVLIGGEQVEPQHVAQWFRHVSPDKVRLINAYGPTEATITCTVSDLTPDNLSSIGKSIHNVDYHLIDDAGERISTPEVAGELCFSGVALSPGYWNRPEQTEKAFVTLDSLDGVRCYRTGDKARFDENGNLYFLGRLDNQIKLRGFRIELDEIASNLTRHPRVKNAVATKSSGDRPALVCFAVVDEIDGDGSALKDELIEFLHDKLPHYMVPQELGLYDQFPVTVGGKVDVSAMVAAIKGDGQDEGFPDLEGLTAPQQQVMEIWESVLGHFPKSIDESFEQSGGDSLAAMGLAVKLEKAFPQKRFGVSTFLSFPTVRLLAEHVSAEEGSGGDNQSDPTLPIISSIGRDLDQCDQCLVLFHPGGGSGYLYNSLLSSTIKEAYAVLIVESPLLTSEIPHPTTDTIRSIALRYVDALSDFLGDKKELVAAGYSFGGLLAIEAARLMQKKGHRIKCVINLDQPPTLVGHECKLVPRLKNWIKRLRYPLLTFQDLRLARHQRAIKRDMAIGINDGTSEEARGEVLKDYYAEIEDRYFPEAFEFKLCLVRGEVFEAKYDLEDDYGWGALTPHLKVRRVSGTHSTLFMGKHHDRLARVFVDAVETGFDNEE